MNNNIPWAFDTDFETDNQSNNELWKVNVEENTRHSIRYNLLSYPEEFLEEYPELSKFNETMTWIDVDETTVALNIWRNTRYLSKIKERWMQKKDIKLYEDTLEKINELKKLNNPDFKHFLEEAEKKLEKANQLIDEEIHENRWPVM